MEKIVKCMQLFSWWIDWVTLKSLSDLSVTRSIHHELIGLSLNPIDLYDKWYIKNMIIIYWSCEEEAERFMNQYVVVCKDEIQFFLITHTNIITYWWDNLRCHFWEISCFTGTNWTPQMQLVIWGWLLASGLVRGSVLQLYNLFF